jgi:hypothetical protein
MKSPKSIRSIMIGVACFVFSHPARAETVETRGAGSAVTSIDRSATFDSLTFGMDIPLSDYTEAGLFIGMNGDSWTKNPSAPDLDPFGGTNPSRAFFATYDGAKGNGPADPNSWTIIRTTDSRKITGVEFTYGNTWTTGGNPPWGDDLAFVEWQTKNGGTVVSSGIDGDPAVSILPLGTILGFRDPAGFDELWVRSRIATSFDPNVQALALDNLSVQLLVPEPSTLVLLFGVAAAGLPGYVWRRRFPADGSSAGRSFQE